MSDLPAYAEHYGFRISTFGTIIGRSIMLEDLRALLAASPLTAPLEDYRAAVIDLNLLGKPTASARELGFRNLAEFYGLDRSIRIFHALRDLWEANPAAQPMLALLCATARDPILRSVTQPMLELTVAAPFDPAIISNEADRHFPSRFGQVTLGSIARNAAASWTQAGLLKRRNNKIRAHPAAHPTSVAYALLLGDLCGARGSALFHTVWTRLLDASEDALREQAVVASRQGWLEYRSMGDATEVRFDHLMREEHP